MSEPQDRPQLYLITPPDMALSSFPDQLAAALDAAPIACLRLRLASDAADDWARAADTLRGVAAERDVPFVVEKHLALAERLALDGVHLTDGSRSVRDARDALGEDGIVGAFCGASRHDGMTAGEMGADYVSFGPVADTGLGGEIAENDLFAWWSEMIEVPVVAEGGLIQPEGDKLTRLRTIAPVADFLGLGADLWADADPVALLKSIDAALD